MLAGSRRGWPSGFTDSDLAPYRAVSFGTGKEVWRLPVPLTASYSRDVDSSGFFYNKRMFSAVESGWFYKLDPFKTSAWNGHRTPQIIASRLLLGDPGDASAHGGNLVLEASPSLLDGIIYISSGAGHIYGMRRSDLKVVWDYRTGSDLDGTPVPDGVRLSARGRGEAVHQRSRRRADARSREERVGGRAGGSSPPATARWGTGSAG